MAQRQIEGQEIVEVRQMTDEEVARNFFRDSGYGPNPAVLVLEDGTKLFPSQDEEGNGPGEIFGSTDDDDFMLMPQS